MCWRGEREGKEGGGNREEERRKKIEINTGTGLVNIIIEGMGGSRGF